MWSTSIVLLALAAATPAPPAPDGLELTRSLHAFLAGASRSDSTAHDRFWADDLIYTGSVGRRIGKADIMRDLRSATAPKPGDPVTTFSAEDIRIQQYGSSALVAFRLVATTVDDGRSHVAHYFNTGTFVKRGGAWKVVGWQATKIPEAEPDARDEVAAADSAFRAALRGADVKGLDALTADDFVWMGPTGERMAKSQLLDAVRSGRSRAAALDPDSVRVTIHGEAGVARGLARNACYSLMFVRSGSEWQAVALQSARP